jgi:PAS domain S-box-containing protein
LKPEDVLGQPLPETYWLSYAEPVKQQLAEAIQRGAQGQGSRYDVAIRVGENHFITIDFSSHPLFDEMGRVIYLVPSATDITERKQAEEALRRRAEELAALYQAGQRLQQLYSPATLAQELIRVLEEVLGYEFGAVLLLDEATGRLIPFALSEQRRGPAFVEVDKTHVAAHDIRLSQGLTGWVAQTSQSLCLGDVRQDPRYYAVRDDIRSELCVPLRAGDKIIGVVNVETTRLNAYTEADQRLLETVAAQIAVAIQNARLYEQVQTGRERLEALSHRLLAAQETERRHLARELHDEIGQTLSMVKIDLQALRVGAAGYLLKDASSAELELAVMAVSRGETYLSPAVSKQVADYVRRVGDESSKGELAHSTQAEPTSPYEQLTPRQREILQLIAEGQTTKEIAQTLQISVKTVEMHRMQLMERLNIHDIAGLVRYAIRVGLITPDK